MVNNYETRFAEALAVSSVETNRIWTIGNQNIIKITNPQIRILNKVKIFSVDVTLGRNGIIVFDDRINFLNPPLGVINNSGQFVYNPIQALKESILDTINAVTNKLTFPRLERIFGDNFIGDTLSVRSSTDDGRIRSSNATYSTARNGSTFSVNTSNTTENVEYTWTGSLYRIEAIFLDFDTASLGAGATVSAGTLTLYGSGTAETSTDAPTIEARGFDWTVPLDSTDWPDFNPGTNWTNLSFMASMALTSWNNTSGSANNLTSQSGMTTWISKTGVTYCCVNYDGSATTTAPTGSNVFNTRMADFAGTSSDPLLTVTYTPGTKAFPFSRRLSKTLRSQHRR